jgi:hypothetical protein
MDELAREYHDTHDPEIPEEIYRIARQLKEFGSLKFHKTRNAPLFHLLG